MESNSGVGREPEPSERVVSSSGVVRGEYKDGVDSVPGWVSGSVGTIQVSCQHIMYSCHVHTNKYLTAASLIVGIAHAHANVHTGAIVQTVAMAGSLKQEGERDFNH